MCNKVKKNKNTVNCSVQMHKSRCDEKKVLKKKGDNQKKTVLFPFSQV